MPTTSLSAAVSEDFVYSKVAWRIIPLLFLSYIAAYLDRVNVSFAKLQMQSDVVDISDSVFGVGAGIFFIGYFIFEVPSNILLEKVGARLWIARIMITWGIISSAMIFVNSQWIFYGLRLLLGFAEAGFFPGIILYLTYWFPSRRRGRAVALFMLAIALAGFDRCTIIGLDPSCVRRIRRLERLADVIPPRRHPVDFARNLYSLSPGERSSIRLLAE